MRNSGKIRPHDGETIGSLEFKQLGKGEDGQLLIIVSLCSRKICLCKRGLFLSNFSYTLPSGLRGGKDAASAA